MRSAHTAWVPPSLPDSIVLLGGSSSATVLTAEIVPGIKSKASDYFLPRRNKLFSDTFWEGCM